MTVFFRILDSDDKAVALREAVHASNLSLHLGVLFELEAETFRALPGAPFSYWVGSSVRDLFRRFPPLEGYHGTVKQGLATTDDARFVRTWWETRGKRVAECWFSFAKGGRYSPYYADLHLSVDWRSDGAQSWAIYDARRDAVGGIIKNPAFYFRIGLTWPRRTTSGLGVRCMPAGCIFADKGPAAFVEGDSSTALLALCAIMNSAPFGYLVAVQLGAADVAARSYEVGLIQQTPIPALNSAVREALAQSAFRSWALTRALDTTNETSHAFLLPSLLRRLGEYDPRAIEVEHAKVQRAIDDLAFDAYGLDGDDRRAIEAWASFKSTRAAANEEDEPANQGGDEEPADTVAVADATTTLRSWAVGVAFGRFDLRLATGERQPPLEPEPFDPLPVRSPGMIPEADEAYFPPRPILADDPGHTLDLAAQVREVLDRIDLSPESLETLRRWLARDFFPIHIKMYSKSRRKAPIYWQLATPTASYSVWLYIHAFTRDTLFKVQNDYVTPKLALEERQLESFRAEIGDSPTAAQRRELESRESFVEELRAFLDEVRRVAPLWNPDLNDGVIINFAPLWRLVPHHKPWQKELKATWDSLCGGEYDWSHLAMHLWPQRVVPKCATDRSLAIAHGLEDVFWLEGEDGKWKPRPIPARPVDEIVAERTSPAVKAALKNLLEAPSVTGGGGRGRPRGRRGGAA